MQASSVLFLGLFGGGYFSVFVRRLNERDTPSDPGTSRRSGGRQAWDGVQGGGQSGEC